LKDWRSGLAAGYLTVLALALAPWLASQPPERQNRDCPCAAPSARFVLGTDELGRDVWSRLLHGGRTSLGAGLIAVTLSTGQGLIAGASGGLSRGRRRRIVLALAELFLAVPWLYLLLAVRAFLPLSLKPGQVLLLLSAVIGVAGWARPGRLLAQLAAEVREQEYVEIAESFGAKRRHLIWCHLMPELMSLARTQWLLLLPGYVLAEVALSLFGLGVGEPAPSWGNLLAPLRNPATAVGCIQLASPEPGLAALVLACEWRGRGRNPRF
jgi:peptide/nickel transport system permease protein